jgi:diadenosine tetraphosphate (Ap4A) HIT family hydrolase
VFHLHLHVVPRREDDPLALATWWESKLQRPMPSRATLDRVAQRLRT